MRGPTVGRTHRFRCVPSFLGATAAVLATATCQPHEPEGKVYVTSGLTDQVFVVDAATGVPLDTLSVDRRLDEVDEPHGIWATPDGTEVYVTTAHGLAALWKFDRTDRLIGRMDLPGFGAGRVSAEATGVRGYVTDYRRTPEGLPGTVTAVRLEDLHAEASTTPCAAPHDVQPSPDGTLLAVTCAWEDVVLILDAETLEERRRIPAGPGPGAAGQPRYRPMNLVWHPTRPTVFVTLMGSHEVAVWDTAGVVHARQPVGRAPAQIARLGGRLITANRLDGSLSVLSLEGDADAPVGVTTVHLEGVEHPHGLAVDESTGTVFLSFEGTTTTPGGVLALDLAQLSERWRTRLGAYVLGVAFRPG